MTTIDDLNGAFALIEVREGRRTHRFVIATLKREGDAVFAIFRERYPNHYPEPARIRIPDKHLEFFRPVAHRDYAFKFQSVLHRVIVESDDTLACARPPIIVTQSDIDAENGNPA